MAKAPAKKVVLEAVRGKFVKGKLQLEEVSKPFRLYETEEVEREELFTLELTADVDRDGNEVIRLGSEVNGLLASHTPDYIKGVLEDFIIENDGESYVVARIKVAKKLPSPKDLFSK